MFHSVGNPGALLAVQVEGGRQTADETWVFAPVPKGMDAALSSGGPSVLVMRLLSCFGNGYLGLFICWSRRFQVLLYSLLPCRSRADPVLLVRRDARTSEPWPRASTRSGTATIKLQSFNALSAGPSPPTLCLAVPGLIFSLGEKCALGRAFALRLPTKRQP